MRVILDLLRHWWAQLTGRGPDEAADGPYAAPEPQPDAESGDKPEVAAEAVDSPEAQGSTGESGGDAAASPADPIPVAEPAGPPPVPLDDDLVDRAWGRWLARVRKWLEQPRGASDPPACDYQDILLAALGMPPGSLFRSDLSQMTLAEWNAVAVRAIRFPRNTKPPPTDPGRVGPRWSLMVAMHRIGFGPAMIRVIENGTDPPDRGMIERLRSLAPLDRAGLLVVEQESGFTDLGSEPGPHAVLVIQERYLPAFEGEIRTFADAGVFSILFREGGSAQAEPSGPTPIDLPTVTLPRRPAEPYRSSELASQYERLRKTP